MTAQKLVQLPVLRGESSPSAKLSRDQAQEIKRALADGEPIKPLAIASGVAYQTLYLIGIGATWKDIEPIGRVLPRRPRISPELRDSIFMWKRENGATLVATAEQFGVSTSAVSRASKEGYAAFALRVHRAVLSTGTYEQVQKRFKIRRAEVEDLLAFVSEGKIPGKLKLEID